jgi:hypothetical protein
MATGIRRRHSAGCRAEDGDRCNCKAGWEASIFDKGEGRKIRRTYAKKEEAVYWRADRQKAKRSGSLRSPSKQTLRGARLDRDHLRPLRPPHAGQRGPGRRGSIGS